LATALFHVAMGRDWAGRRVLRGAVVYIVAEGKEGFKRRLIAMRRHFGVEGQKVPFGIITVAPDLGHKPGDVEVLTDQVRAWQKKNGNPPVRAIAIDTAARTLKGADESSAKDMGYTDPDQKPDSARAQINTNLNTLAARQRIGLTKEHVWLPDGAK